MVSASRRGSRHSWPATPVAIGLAGKGRRAASSLLLCAFASLWLLDEASGVPRGVEVVAGVAFTSALLAAAYRRWRPAPGTRITLLDFELGGFVLLALLVAVAAAPGGLEGPSAGALYVAFALAAAWARPLASAGIWALSMGLFSVQVLAGLERGLGHLPLGLLLGVTAAATRLAWRSRLAGAERRARESLDLELEKVRDEARSYRLTRAPNEAREPARPFGAAAQSAGDDDPRLLRSSVEEIHATLNSALTLCRVALGCRSVLVLWLDDRANTLHVRAMSAIAPAPLLGPFPAREGLFAAALDSEQLVELVGPSAQRPLPYHRGALKTGHLALLPLGERGRAAGLLALDRELARSLSEVEREILMETSRLCLRTIDNERVLLSLERAKHEQARLYRAVERLNEARSEVQVIQAGVGSAADFASFQFAAVTLLRADGEHEICAVSGEGADDLCGKTFRDQSGLVGMVVANRHPLPYRDQRDASVRVLFTRELPAPPLPSLLVLPLLVHREVLGTLVLGSEEPGGFEGDVRLILQVLAGHVAVSLANARMVKRLEELATTDGLTGLLNKRATTEIGRQKLRAAQRFKKPLSLLICDLDHFKAVNDTHGHDIGDRVLVGFADVLRRAKRETDTVGRFGGEEFVVVCEQTDARGAELLAERIRGELELTTFVTPSGTLKATCSIGVATYPAGSPEWDALFKAADEALYVSKRTGRNRVTRWSPRLIPRLA